MASNKSYDSSIIAKDVVKDRVIVALRKDGLALRILFQNAFASDSNLTSDIGLTSALKQEFNDRLTEFQDTAAAFIEDSHGIEYLEGNKKNIVLIQNGRKASFGGLNFKCCFSIAETNVLVGLHSADLMGTQSDIQRNISQGMSVTNYRCAIGNTSNVLTVFVGIWARILQRGWGVFRRHARTAVDLKDRWRSITGLREVNHFAEPIHEGKPVRKHSTIGADLAGLLIADIQMSRKRRYRNWGPGRTLYGDDSDRTNSSESPSHPSAASHSDDRSSGTDSSTVVDDEGSIWGGAEFASAE